MFLIIEQQLRMKEQIQIFENSNSSFLFPLLVTLFSSHASLNVEAKEDENLQFFMEAVFYEAP